MKLNFYTQPAGFLQQAQPFLEAEEAANILILGITLRLREHPEWIERQPYLATVEDAGGTLILAAAITPPNNLIAAGSGNVPQAAIDMLVSHLREGGWEFAGFNAEKRLSERLAQAWQRATGQPTELKMRLRLYELRQVIPPPQPPPGSLRVAAIEEIPLILRWRSAFTIESLHQQPNENLQGHIERSVQTRSVFIWDDQGPVSMAISTRPTPHGITIGGVYTPPELRGRGYASACVAALSQRLLNEGRAFCSLFTDLNYPTSNSIYQKIGYRPICDFAEYHKLQAA